MASGLPTDKRIVQIVAEVAESTDENMLSILLGLKSVLDDHPFGSSKASAVRHDLWEYGLIQVTNSVLRQFHNSGPSELSTATELCTILMASCCGLTPDDNIAFQREFLPGVTDTMLFILLQSAEAHINAKRGNDAEKILNDGLKVITALSDILQFYKFLSLTVLSSKRFLQLLMVEDSNISLMMMNLVISAVKADRNSFADLPEEKLHSIVDELVFKLSAASDATIACLATRVLLFCLDTYPPLLDLLTSKRYKGLKAYLGKWKGKGFASEIFRLTSILEAKSTQQVEAMKIFNAASKIQAAYRGYKVRQKLAKASRAIGSFQRRYRLRKAIELGKQQENELRKAKQEIKNSQRRREFMTSRLKQLKIMETVPAKTVNAFLEELQVKSATKIQSCWRGHKARTVNKPTIDKLRRTKAAVLIQRHVKRWLKRRKDHRQRLINDLYPEGLDDNRRVQLQNVIANVREQFPAKSRDIEEVKKLHNQAHTMLSTYYAQLPSIRRKDDHRYALVAQVTILSEQLTMAAHLKDASDIDFSAFSSSSKPVTLAAKRQHQEMLKNAQRRWWEKLTDDDSTALEKEFSLEVEKDKQF